MDLDFDLDITPVYAAQYSYCFYSISISTQYNSVIDSSQNYVKFVDLSNVFATSAVINFNSHVYTPSLVGSYVVTISYSWNQNISKTSTISVTLVDPCILAVTPPASISNSSQYLSDANLQINIGPSITTAY